LGGLHNLHHIHIGRVDRTKTDQEMFLSIGLVLVLES
jgi:hypothetical protein